MPGIRKRSRVAIYDANKFKDEKAGPSIYCQRCLDMANHLSKLTTTIYSKNTNDEVTIMHDSDTLLQCQECGTVYPSYEVKQEGKLTDVVEIPDSPADFGKVIIRSIYKSRKYTGKKKKGTTDLKRIREELSKVKDKDLRRDLAKGGELISYEGDNATS